MASKWWQIRELWQSKNKGATFEKNFCIDKANNFLLSANSPLNFGCFLKISWFSKRESLVFTFRLFFNSTVPLAFFAPNYWYFSIDFSISIEKANGIKGLHSVNFCWFYLQLKISLWYSEGNAKIYSCSGTPFEVFKRGVHFSFISYLF